LVTAKNVVIIRKVGNLLISDKNLYEAQDMAEKLLKHLVALDFWVEFSWLMMGVYFSNYLQDRMIRNGSFGNAKF
jgi:hypothetical protein